MSSGPAGIAWQQIQNHETKAFFAAARRHKACIKDYPFVVERKA
jgi:hypothetical protein